MPDKCPKCNGIVQKIHTDAPLTVKGKKSSGLRTVMACKRRSCDYVEIWPSNLPKNEVENESTDSL